MGVHVYDIHGYVHLRRCGKKAFGRINTVELELPDNLQLKARM